MQFSPEKSNELTDQQDMFYYRNESGHGERMRYFIVASIAI